LICLKTTASGKAVVYTVKNLLVAYNARKLWSVYTTGVLSRYPSRHFYAKAWESVAHLSQLSNHSYFSAAPNTRNRRKIVRRMLWSGVEWS
jgi:hypothetical protein